MRRGLIVAKENITNVIVIIKNCDKNAAKHCIMRTGLVVAKENITNVIVTIFGFS